MPTSSSKPLTTANLDIPPEFVESVLRACAEAICQRIDREIVSLGPGTSAFMNVPFAGPIRWCKDPDAH